jgi:dolichyl-phosphate beta-glucosyltransferase
MSEGGVDLSVILPAFNEERLIEARLVRLSRHLSRRNSSWEIVVVDDGSTDGTSARIENVRRDEPRLRLVTIPANAGKGNAIARGIGEARGAILATTDADLSYALADLDAAVAAIEGGADIATGNRRHAQSRINLSFGVFPYLVRRWITGGAFRLLVRALFDLRAGDTQCGLKAYSRKAASAIMPRLVTRRFLADIEILLAARGLGLRVAEIPVHLRYLSAESSVRLLRGFPSTLADLARIKAAEMRGAYE